MYMIWVGKIISNEFDFLNCFQARNISAQFEERHEAKTVGEMKLFVERLPQMQVGYSLQAYYPFF